MLDGADYIFFGCWTSGLMIILQKPEKAWVEFTEKLPSKPNAKVAMFTTYNILTGNKFRNMYKQLEENFPAPELEVKSRNGLLSEKNKQELDQFIS